MQCRIITCQYPGISSTKLPYYDFLAQGPMCGFWQPPTDYVSPKKKTGLQSDNMSYEREYIMGHIRQIGILWVHMLSLAPPVGDIW